MATNKDTGGQRQTTRRAEETEEAEAGTTEEVRERHEKLSDVDAILDEIDEVLEENAEEFVRSYVQKGGQ
jgi:ubiquitin-like protein Pup